MILLIIILLIFFLLKNVEPYDGMNYMQKHAHMLCCRDFGCKHPRCKKFLNIHKSNMVSAGYMTNNKKIYNLYYSIDQNSMRKVYFVGKKNKDNDIVYIKINNRYIYDGDTIDFEKKKYKVSLYEDDEFIRPINRRINKNIRRRIYTYPMDDEDYKYGYIRPSDKLNDNFLLLYRKPAGRNKWRYYVKKNDTFIRIKDIDYKDLSKGDKLKIPFSKKDYIFEELD